jgi:hypothetical protein
MAFNPQKRTLALATLLMTALALGGCSSQLADAPILGASADAPPRPGEQGAYLPVNDLPPDRADTQMDPATRDKLKAELIAARNRQAAATKDAASKDAASKDAASKDAASK